MRYYLDTNILVYMLFDRDELHRDTKAILGDESNLFMTSAVCAAELIHLIQIGKIHVRGQKDNGKACAIAIQHLDDFGIAIVPVDERHLGTLAALPLYDDHRDPADRLIVAQAIADRVPLVSSDGKFDRYVRHGLDFVLNER